MHRGLNMAGAADVLAGATLTVEDDRQDYGEAPFRMAVSVSGMPWTVRRELRLSNRPA